MWIEERDNINIMEYIKQFSTYRLNFEMCMIEEKKVMFIPTSTQNLYKLNPKH